jgi:hypothetical protein
MIVVTETILQPAATTTVKAQTSAPAPEVIRLNLKLRLEARVLQLVETIKKSKLVPNETLDMFTVQFSEQNPQNKNEHERISLLFCFLICDVLRPLLIQETNRKKQIVLEKYEGDLIILLKETVPEGETVDAFIDSYERFSVDEEMDRALLEKITECFNNAIKRAYNSANVVDTEIVTTFESLKTRIREINRKRQTMTQELQGTLDELSVRVERAIQVGKQITQDQKKIAQRMKEDRVKFEKNAQLFELILKKV